MTTRLIYRLLLTLTLLIALGGGGAVRAEPPVNVFAAASLKNALDDVAARFEHETGDRINLAYGGSSALARQIQYGAPAQIFLSANVAWMDVLESEGLLVTGTRANLLSNQLVLIAGPDTDISLTIGPDMNIVGALNGGRLAMALVHAVPAGVYGRTALQTLGLWDEVQNHIAQTDNVRAALRLVALGEAPLGIVYITDAIAEPGVKVVGAFPSASHPPILYPVARLAQGDTAAALAFYEFLTGPAARAVFVQHGFGTPDEGTR